MFPETGCFGFFGFATVFGAGFVYFHIFVNLWIYVSVVVLVRET